MLEVKKHYDLLSTKIEKLKSKNPYFHKEIERFYKFNIPENSIVLEIGCGIGDLLASVNPSIGFGIDFSENLIKIAKKRHPKPNLKFFVMAAEEINFEQKFDFIIISGLLQELEDIQEFLLKLHQIITPQTRIIINEYSYLWRPIIKLLNFLRLKTPEKIQNWLTLADIENLLFLSDFEVIKKDYRLLIPLYIPLVSNFINHFLAKLPVIRRFCLMEYLIAKQHNIIKDKKELDKYTCSIIVPCRNEKGNIESIVKRIPNLGSHTEIIFVEGNSTDGTLEEIKRVMKEYNDRDIKLILQGEGIGKGDAVRKGFDKATGEVLMILDADITVAPEDLTKFYYALVSGKGEFINGSRLVYSMEKGAMKALNVIGNKFFSLMFTWLLEQRFKDTLCGTKVLFKRDYEKIVKGRKFFGDFDPFGDFDLIFGASKLNLKIVELPVRYKERIYGTTNISRFKHGWLLLQMCFLAFIKLKLN